MYADTLRDNLTLQQLTETDDLAGGFTHTWTAVLRIKCRVVQMSAEYSSRVYGRETNFMVLRVEAADRIPTTDGEQSLHKLLRKRGETQFRLLWRGDRTISPIRLQLDPSGRDNHMQNMVTIDCIETPEVVGFADS